MSIEFKEISKSFDGNMVLQNVSFSIPQHGIFGIFGPSGCGKTTLLRILCGLESPDSGTITGVDGLTVSMVFQEDRLLPSCTAAENVSLVSDEKTAAKVLDLVGLGRNLNYYPDELSGGMKRRVAIARALAFKSDIMILDEPFKGLESDLKQSITSLIVEYSQTKPVVLVTHDETEKQIVDLFIDIIAQKQR